MQLLKIKAQMSSIWAKGCMLMIVCVCYLTVEGESHGILLLLLSNIIIIYHDFLPTPMRGSHVKSDKTHTQSSKYKHYPIYLTPEP